MRTKMNPMGANMEQNGNMEHGRNMEKNTTMGGFTMGKMTDMARRMAGKGQGGRPDPNMSEEEMMDMMRQKMGGHMSEEEMRAKLQSRMNGEGGMSRGDMSRGDMGRGGMSRGDMDKGMKGMRGGKK